MSRRTISKRGGMTLVEVLAAMAILALAALMVLTAFSGAQSLMRRGADRQRTGDALYSQLALMEAEGQPMEAVVKIGRQTYRVPGTVYGVSDSDSGAAFHSFVPD